MAVVAALDASLGGVRAYLEHTFNDRIFVVAFAANAVVAIAIGLDRRPARRRPGHCRRRRVRRAHLPERRGSAPPRLRRLSRDGHHRTRRATKSSLPAPRPRRIGSILLVIGVTALVGFLAVGQLRGVRGVPAAARGRERGRPHPHPGRTHDRGRRPARRDLGPEAAAAAAPEQPRGRLGVDRGGRGAAAGAARARGHRPGVGPRADDQDRRSRGRDPVRHA